MIQQQQQNYNNTITITTTTTTTTTTNLLVQRSTKSRKTYNNKTVEISIAYIGRAAVEKLCTKVILDTDIYSHRIFFGLVLQNCKILLYD